MNLQFNKIVSIQESMVDALYCSSVEAIQELVGLGSSAMALRAVEEFFDHPVAQSMERLSEPTWNSVPAEIRQEAIQKLQDLVKQKSDALRAMVTGEQ